MGLFLFAFHKLQTVSYILPPVVRPLLITSSYMGSFGALITIFALAVDPFSQQVIKYTYCLQAVDGLSASVAVANTYYRVSKDSFSLDAQMVSASYAALVDIPSNTSAIIPFTCETGNCTFSSAQSENGATHMSLGLCGQCEDMSSSIITNHSILSGSSYNTTSSYNITQYLLPEPDDYPTPGINYHSDSGLAYAVNVTVTTPPLIADYENVIVYSNWLVLQSYPPNNYSQYLIHFDVLTFRNCSCAPTSWARRCTCEPFAARCSIFPCLKTYRAEVTNFVLRERELSRQTLYFHDYIGGGKNDYESGWGMWTKRTLRHGKWFTCSNSTKATEGHDYALMTDDNVYTYTQEECVWGYGEYAALYLGEYLSVNDNLDGNGAYHSRSSSTGPDTASGAPWLLAILNNGSATLGSLQSSLDGLTNSLTAVVRQYGGSSEAIRPVGITWRSETCITVQWVWLSLPATLLLFAIIFLTLTIWKTGTRQVYLWKSSPLALLFHGIENHIKDDHGPLDKVRDMKTAASSINVRIDRRSGTWQLSSR